METGVFYYRLPDRPRQEEISGRYCLDEGIVIFDKNRTSNLQTANNDVAHSKDERLCELVNSKSNRIPTGVKR